MNKTTAYLNSNDGSSILALGEKDRIRISGKESLEGLEAFLVRNQGSYRFGLLSYDLKEALHGLNSNNPDLIHAPHVTFWVPECVVRMDHENFEFLSGEKNEMTLELITEILEEETNTNYHQHLFRFEPSVTKEDYLKTVLQLKAHIQRGDIYEINYCQEFIAKDVKLTNVWDTYFKLNHLTKAPHSAFVQLDEFALFCGSPERFLRKKGTRLISEPIKGTARRAENSEEDLKLKEKLRNDPKERSENIMIVDLVRNDLSRVAQKGSVEVEELCGIYTFETVHQMISTIACELRPELSLTEILTATFPMGSMTGAPKRRAMELIEEYENFQRGLYSGSVGYIDPAGDFDFNVVIRSLLYNSERKVLSCAVGSAITIQSDPEREYEECMVKIKRIMDGINE
ncbi:MAG: aminodeoxychorismate synthase component I [Cryomorphaceae bacterium]|nr:aminodeoxychorismate synthase component I [Cryomorphaceae bacterium]